MTDPTPGIEFRQVRKRYGGEGAPWAVDGIDLVVPRGTLTTILGPSGCGKTTTLRMIAGLEAPNAGTILIDGQDVTALGAAERNVSMVFQSYALFPHMNVLANVGYGLTVQGLAPATVQERALAALQTVGLSGFEQRQPSELSGGQQQRVAVARALVLEPSVMLFDEPLSNLDARLRRAMREEIRALQQRLKLTVAYVTHDQGEALAVSDQVIVMNAGRIAQAGAPRQLYEQPADAFVAGFMGEATLFDGEAQADGSLRLGPLRLPAPRPVVAGAVKLAVRPEAWRVRGPVGAAEAAGAASAAGMAGTGADNGLPGTLRRCTYLGAWVELSFTTELGEIFVVSPDVDRSFIEGQAATLALTGHGVAVVGG